MAVKSNNITGRNKSDISKRRETQKVPEQSETI